MEKTPRQLIPIELKRWKQDLNLPVPFDFVNDCNMENRMKKNLNRLSGVALIAFIGGWSLVVREAEAAVILEPCNQVRSACLAAGFAWGGNENGTGTITDCMGPLLGGIEPVNAIKPLPLVDPKIIAACRLEDPTGAYMPGGQVAELPQVGTPLINGLTKPNIVFVLTDDLTTNLIKYMPNVRALQSEGTSFANFFVTDSLCCPSRSSIFTGRFPHDTGVYTNGPPDGGYTFFYGYGNEAITFAVALQENGYRTALMGKYMNGYLPDKNPPPAGWSEWDVAGDAYAEFDYDLNENGKIVHYGTEREDYLTDVLARHADRFIRESATAPFFIEIATFAPHVPYVPAPRDTDKYSGLKVPRTPTFGARPDRNAPRWLKGIPPLRQDEIAGIDQIFRKQAQSVQAVDKMIGELKALLVSLGIADKTFVVFSSDNGLDMGDYSLRPGKLTPFNTDVNVPLVVAGPGIQKGELLNQIVENIDLSPTFTDLGGGQGPTKPDGRSLLPLLFGSPNVEWRRSALIEHRRPNNFDLSDPDAPIPDSANPITYEALRTANFLYVEYENGETSLYDLTKDPFELKNIAKTTPEPEIQKLRSILAANKHCHGSQSCWEAQRLQP